MSKLTEIGLRCPHCSQVQEIPEEYLGRTVKCLDCGYLLEAVPQKVKPSSENKPSPRSYLIPGVLTGLLAAFMVGFIFGAVFSAPQIKQPLATNGEIDFAGFHWAPEKPYVEILALPEWTYRTANPRLRLIERRGQSEPSVDWTAYAAFEKLQLHARTMQELNPRTNKWVDHGLCTVFYDDGTIVYAVSENGKLLRDLGVMVPAQPWIWEQ